MTSVTDTLLSDTDLVTSAIPTAVAEEIARLRAENAAFAGDECRACGTHRGTRAPAGLNSGNSGSPHPAMG